MAATTQKGNTFFYKGSNYFKQRLILSVLSGKPVKISEIRLRDQAPGLREFEICLIRLLDKITNGTMIELNESGTSLYFKPGLLYGGKIEHNCCIQRGIGYYLEALLMLGLFCKQPLNAKLYGVTSNNLDPSVDLIKTSMIQVLKQFVFDDEGIELKINKRGMLPLGDGEVTFKCPVRSKLKPVQLLNNGMVKRIRGTAYALRMSTTMASRIVESAKGVLLTFIPDVYISIDQCKGKQAGKSPGFGVHLYAETTNGIIYSSEQISNVPSSSDELLTPEVVGTAAAQRLLYEIYLGGITDSTCQALAILNMALGQKDVSKIIIGPPTDYTIGFLRNLRDFFGITFKIEHFEDVEDQTGTGGRKVLLTCVGIGYSNINRRTI